MARARAYILGRIPEDQKFRGQSKLIVAQLGRDEAQAKTVKEIADAITHESLGDQGLVTRQDPIRVVSFYMSVWKKKGWVKAVEVERDEETAEKSEEAEDTQFNSADDGTNASPAERMEVANEVEVTATHEEAGQTPPDFTGMRVSDAVLTVLQRAGGTAQSAEAIADYLTRSGYEIRTKQVQSALSNLISKGSVRKPAEGVYARA